jgi:hypothetical protein
MCVECVECGVAVDGCVDVWMCDVWLSGISDVALVPQSDLA